MKKYIKPVLNITTIQLQTIIALSDPQVGIDPITPPQNPGGVGVKHLNDDFDDFDNQGSGEDWDNGLW
jgi:hypothetical protein